LSSEHIIYTLMNKNVPVLVFEFDDYAHAITKIVKVENPEYLPVGLNINSQTFRKDFNDWFRGRSIPASRQNLLGAMEALELSSSYELITKGYALSLSDQYWVRPDPQLTWKDINYFDNAFSDDVGNSLMGIELKTENPVLKSPDNTSDGWLRKRWKIVKGKRVLLKGGSGHFLQEPVNEVLATKILEDIQADNFVSYKLEVIDSKPFSICENFITPDTELVTAHQISLTKKRESHISRYEHFLACCADLEIPNVESFLHQQIALDYLIVNTDRHWGNFGAIRDVNTLKFIGMAPIYDNGTSLWHDKSNTAIDAVTDFKTEHPRPFKRDIFQQLKLATSFENFDVAKLNHIEDKLNEVLSASPSIDEARNDALCSAIMARRDKMKRIIEDI